MNSEQPFFSIVIPTYARPNRLKNCLQSLVNIDYPRSQFEVLVIDDGSDVPIQQAVEQAQSLISLTLLRQENQGPATARNKGAACAQGEFLIFIDDDCTLAPDYLANLASNFAEQPNNMIGGRTVNALPENPYATVSQLLIDYFYATYTSDSQQANFFTSNNMALPKAHFHTIGGFDTTFPLAAGEDRDLCDRWICHKFDLSYVPEAIIYHSHAMTLAGFWRQHFNYGCGSFHFHQLRAQRQSQAIVLERLSFYLNLLRYPLSQEQSPRVLLLLWLMLLSQIANAMGFFWARFAGNHLNSVNQTRLSNEL